MSLITAAVSIIGAIAVARDRIGRVQEDLKNIQAQISTAQEKMNAFAQRGADDLREYEHRADEKFVTTREYSTTISALWRRIENLEGKTE